MALEREYKGFLIKSQASALGDGYLGSVIVSRIGSTSTAYRLTPVLHPVFGQTYASADEAEHAAIENGLLAVDRIVES
jgi:hypothetical protein